MWCRRATAGNTPFAAEIQDGVLYGRGAADMKSAIAAFVAASARVLASGPVKGSISLLITGDEEGPAINGTAKMLAWLKEQGRDAGSLRGGRADLVSPSRRHAEDRPPRLDQFPASR